MNINKDKKTEFQKMSQKELRHAMMMFLGLALAIILTILYLLQESSAKNNISADLQPYLLKEYKKRDLLSITVAPFVMKDSIYICYKSRKTHPNEDCFVANKLDGRYEYMLYIGEEDKMKLKANLKKEKVNDAKKFQNYIYKETIKAFKAIDDHQDKKKGS